MTTETPNTNKEQVRGCEASELGGLVNCPTAEQVLKDAYHHPDRYKCPACGDDVSRIAMVRLVYTYEPCDCDIADYTHLVERVYHRECFIKANTGS